MNNSLLSLPRSLDNESIFTASEPKNVPSLKPLLRPLVELQQDAFAAHPNARQFIGHGFREATAATLALPISAVRQVTMDVLRPIGSGIANIVGAVLGTALGLVGGGLGAVIKLVTRFAPIDGAKDGYHTVRNTVRDIVSGITALVVDAAEIVLRAVELLVTCLGWLLGAIVTGPTFLLGRY